MQTTNPNYKEKETAMTSALLYDMIYKTNYNCKPNHSLHLQI